MRIIILIILIFFSFGNIANSIPVPALAIGYEFIILVIPSLIAFFSIIFFYFRKYLFYINIFLLILSIFLYFIHYYITKEFFFYNLEYLYFIIPIIFLVFSFKYKLFGYFLLFFILYLNLFLIKIDYNLLSFKMISNCVEKNMYSNISITKILYKDNFLVIYGYDNESKLSAYTVIENGLLDDNYYLNKGKYYIVHGGYRWLGKGLSDLSYNCIR